MRGSVLVWVILAALSPPGLRAQDDPAQERGPTGWEVTGFPAMNYSSDEGFGYGSVLAAYDYGAGGWEPYRMSFLPTVFLTTKGRRELTLFFDAPHLLPRGWRVDAFLGTAKQVATPYYGVGNQTPYDPALESGDDPYFYRFGRRRDALEVNLQRRVGEAPLRFLVGGQLSRLTVDPTPKNQGSTLLAQELGSGTADPGGSLNGLRVGLIWDTRDRESGPRAGVWSELLVERVDELLGSETSFTRWTLTDRRYVSLTGRLVFANRFLLQTLTGDPPFYALSFLESSFGGSEALGGAGSVRGVLWNRYQGEGLFIWNPELRWRVKDFRILGRQTHLALTGFVDSGRVWAEGVELASLFSDLHHGFGGGLRFGFGPNFVLGLDLAVSDEAGIQTYTGLGYLF